MCGLNGNTINACYFLQYGSQQGVGDGDDSGATAFGNGTWPNGLDDSWAVDASGTIGHWKDLGSWNNGNPTFPKLWWEE